MKDDIENNYTKSQSDDIYNKSSEDFIEMNTNDFSFLDNFEVVPYLNNNSDSIQDELNEIEKNTKNIQNNLISADNDNIEYVDFNSKK